LGLRGFSARVSKIQLEGYFAIRGRQVLGHDMDWKKNRLELKNEEAGYGAAIELLLSHRPSPLFASCCSRLFSSGCEGERGGGLIEDSNLHHNGALVISHLLKDNAKRLLHA